MLVVLAILAITASLVPVAWRAAPPTDGGVQRIVQRARREAIRRGHTVRLRVDNDGTWALLAQQGAVVIDSGVIDRDGQAAAPMMADVLIDALGTCQPSDAPIARPEAGDFDMLDCATVWRGTALAGPRR